MLGLHHQIAFGAEQRAGRVPALLDVRRMAGPDQHRAHLLAGGSQCAGRDAQGDRVEAHCFSIRIVPDSSTSPDHPGGTASVASRSSTTAGPSIRLARLRLAGDDLGVAVDGVSAASLGALGGLAHGLGVDLRAGCGRGGAKRHKLNLSLRVTVAVRLLVGLVEILLQMVAERHRQLERLPAVAQLGDELHVSFGIAQLLAGALRQLVGLVLQVRGLQQHAALRVAAALGHHQTQRGQHARGPRAEDLRDPQLLGDRGRVQAAGAAERHQGEVAGVDAALDGHHAQRPDHLGVGDADDPLGGLALVEAERVAEVRHGRLRRLAIEFDPARDPAEQAQQQVRVGDGRLLAAVTVRRRARTRAGAARTDPERAARVAPGDRAAAGADGVDVEHRQRDGAAADLATRRLADLAVEHDADVAARAAHVEAQGVRLARRMGGPGRAGGAAGRAGEHGQRGVVGGLLE